MVCRGGACTQTDVSSFCGCPNATFVVDWVLRKNVSSVCNDTHNRLVLFVFSFVTNDHGPLGLFGVVKHIRSLLASVRM